MHLRRAVSATGAIGGVQCGKSPERPRNALSRSRGWSAAIIGQGVRTNASTLGAPSRIASTGSATASIGISRCSRGRPCQTGEKGGESGKAVNSLSSAESPQVLRRARIRNFVYLEWLVFSRQLSHSLAGSNGCNGTENLTLSG